MTSSGLRPVVGAAARLLRGSSAATANRAASTTAARPAADAKGGDGAGAAKTGFFGSFFDRKVATQDTPHSAKFASAKEEIIELQTHNVRPDAKDKYLDAHKRLVDYFNERSELLHWYDG